jgi:hypothetical protein
LRRAEELTQWAVVRGIGERLDGWSVTMVGGIRRWRGIDRAWRRRAAVMAAVGGDRIDVRTRIRAMKMMTEDAMPAGAEQRNAAKKGRKGPNRGSLNQNVHHKNSTAKAYANAKKLAVRPPANLVMTNHHVKPSSTQISRATP